MLESRVMLVLASNSPRRRQLMAIGGWTFTLAPVDVDERPLPGEHPRNYVMRLAEQKARAAVGEVGELPQPLDFSAEDLIVVAADTTVADGDDILGKPANAAEAQAMLRRLRGRTHRVYTAVVGLRLADGFVMRDTAETEVPMRDYRDDEMLAYIASGDPLDKAGAYAIQHDGFRPVERLQGCYANVMGLPLCHLKRTLERIGIQSDQDIPQACQAALEYDCPVHTLVLRGEK
jgi:septum formation protein